GNTHTHTTNSDGDTGPDSVATWYKSHGYNFLVLSDHNFFTDPTKLDNINDSNFLLISGEELTSSFQSKPVHVNGLNIPHLLEAQRDSTLLGTIQKNVDEVRRAEGVPHINHPNFRWAFDHEVLRHVRNDRLLEIFNGHPLVHNEGGGGKLSLEEIWDKLLTEGKRVYGIAVDDAHHFKGEFAKDRSNPGRGWICVSANVLNVKEIMTNLEEGLFYASTGVVLEDVVVTPRSLEVIVKPESDFRYVIEFIGDEGRVLKRVEDTRGEFELNGQLAYVRATVRDSGGSVAWVQPLFVKP
ncbi:MAG: PHP domain-containing protein, partial [Ignavibacteriales bacterium]|nr:PHP domain-containing protein [Ignavibacteriales bacterium]